VGFALTCSRGSKPPAGFTPAGPRHALPFPISRVPAVQVPPRERYYESVRLPGSLSPHFVAFAWRYQTPRLFFAPVSPGRTTAGQGFSFRSPLPDEKRLETIRVSQVPEEALCAYALFFDPGGTDTPGLTA
jgi:hypothetical protein